MRCCGSRCQTLRGRRGTLAGAFVAIWLAVTLAYGTGLLMEGALAPRAPAASRPPRPCGPTGDTGGRYRPCPRRGSTRRCVPRVERRRRRRRLPVGAWPGRTAPRSGGHCTPMAGPSAALTPYRLGRPARPSGPREVVADERLAAGAARAARRDARGGSDVPRHRRRRRPARRAFRARRRPFFAPTRRRTALVGRARPGRRDRRLAEPRRESGDCCASASAPALARGPRPRPRGRRRRRRPARRRPRDARRRSSARWAGSPARSRCSSSPARSRWPSRSGGARSPCCARSAPRRIRSGG